MTHHTLTKALEHPDASLRLTAALGAGMAPHPGKIAPLVQRCRIEPDFFVRDMLTWALTRHAQDLTVPLLLDELRSPLAQARSQALHTLSKIGDPATWPAITSGHLHDPDPEVARTAWRTAAGLAPTAQRVSGSARVHSSAKWSSTRSMRSVGSVVLAWVAVMTSANKRSTKCSLRWMALRPTKALL